MALYVLENGTTTFSVGMYTISWAKEVVLLALSQ